MTGSTNQSSLLCCHRKKVDRFVATLLAMTVVEISCFVASSHLLAILSRAPRMTMGMRIAPSRHCERSEAIQLTLLPQKEGGSLRRYTPRDDGFRTGSLRHFVPHNDDGGCRALHHCGFCSYVGI